MREIGTRGHKTTMEKYGKAHYRLAGLAGAQKRWKGHKAKRHNSPKVKIDAVLV